MVKYSSLQPIIEALQQGPLGVSEIADKIGKSRIIVHQYVKELLQQGKIKKQGLGSHVKYILTDISHFRETKQQFLSLSYEDSQIIEHSFYKFSENGKLFEGLFGFTQRCERRGLDAQSKSSQYIMLYRRIQSMKNQCGLIDATQVFKKNLGDLQMNTVYYADQYNRLEFGRGKLAEMTFYAKQSQNLTLIDQSLQMVMLQIRCLLQAQRIDAIAITPPSVVRVRQFLKILQKKLEIFGLPFVRLIKYYPHKIPIPQKTLKSREQRIRNAHDTIILDDPHISRYKKILLIDDFVGSGATLNESARKLRDAGVQTIVGFAFVGNTDLSYDVINEI